MLMEPVISLETEAVEFALAALVATLKDAPRATRRCRNRMTRAIEALEYGDRDGYTGDLRAPAAAVGVLRRACDQCGRCPGVDIVTPPDACREPLGTSLGASPDHKVR